MGIQESKLEEPINFVVQDSQQNGDEEIDFNRERRHSAPLLTPTSLIDPRSPSANIARTPVEVVLRKNTKKDDEIAENSSPVVILADDPRSPAIDFHRTPIVLNVIPKLGTQLYNKNLDNVRKTLLNTEMKTKVTPKLLESSPIAFNSNVYKRRSMAGVLETNIDFTETDLDDVQKCKQELNKTLPDKITTDCMTPVSNKIKQQMEKLCLDTQEEEEEEETKVPEMNITAQVKKLDKKLSTLIYEDDDCEVTNVKIVRNIKNNRTPLGNRDMNKDVKKSASKLRVSDKPRKSDGKSRIPVLRKGVQCENTPPHLLESRNLRSKWDADKTLVI